MGKSTKHLTGKRVTVNGERIVVMECVEPTYTTEPRNEKTKDKKDKNGK